MQEEKPQDELIRIGIMLYPQVEDLDFVGPLEVFHSAGWKVFTVAETDAMVVTSSGLLVQPNYTFTNHPPIDIVLVPGGNEHPQVVNSVVLAWLRSVTAHARITTSVCTGAFLLATLGILDGHRATTHWGSLDRLKEGFPQVQVQRDTRWVDEGTIVTAAGISAGIDMSLHIVERLSGRASAEAVARYMEYAWDQRGQ